MTVITILLLAAGILLLLYLGRRPILGRIGQFLVDADRPSPDPDLIVLMNGNISTRPFLAADLYKQHKAPIVLARLSDTEETRMGVIPNISEATRDLLIRLGVDGDDVFLLKSDRWIAGTWYEAILHCKFIRENGYQRIAIVTDAFHTRRAVWTFRKNKPDTGVTFFGAPTRFSMGLVSKWWHSEFGLIQVVNEYLKFLHYRRLARSVKAHEPPSEEDLLPEEQIRPVICGKRDFPDDRD